MFVVVEFPFVDLRPFLHSETHRLFVPSFPLPEPGRDFLRSTGRVERRRRGGLHNWAGEEVYCHAKRAIRFQSRLGRVRLGPPSRTPIRCTCAFRRFHSDGRVARLEVGLQLSGRSRAVRSLDGVSVLHLLQDCLELEVWIAEDSGRPSKKALVEAPRSLAQHFLRSTTQRKKGTMPAVEPWWFPPGEPLLVVEFLPGEIAELPMPARPLEPFADWDQRLYYGRFLHDAQGVGVWFVERHPIDTIKSSDKKEFLPVTPRIRRLRQLRIHLLRLHSEVEALKQVLRAASRGRLKVEPGTSASDELQHYLNAAIRLLERRERYGFDQEALLDSVLRCTSIVAPGERTSLVAELRKVRRNVLRKVELFTAKESREAGITNVYIRRQVVERQIHLEGVTIMGDFNLVTAEKIENSFNRAAKADHISENLRSGLKELCREVAELAKRLPKEAAERVAQDLEVLSTEAVSPKPRKQWYQLSAKGLIEAAQTVGEVAAPVVKTVKMILGLLASGG